MLVADLRVAPQDLESESSRGGVVVAIHDDLGRWNSPSKAKNDLAAFVQKEVAKGVKASLAASAAKKRKSDSESSDEDLNMFDLKDFNYEDMENLKIDSEDDISV